MEGISQSLDVPLNEGYEIFEETWSKNKIKKKAIVDRSRKGVSQENQDQILALKSQKGRGRVVGEFCVADAA